MTGPDHYREAEHLLVAGSLPPEERDYTASATDVLLAALTHAVLALTAAATDSGAVGEWQAATAGDRSESDASGDSPVLPTPEGAQP